MEIAFLWIPLVPQSSLSFFCRSFSLSHDADPPLQMNVPTTRAPTTRTPTTRATRATTTTVSAAVEADGTTTIAAGGTTIVADGAGGTTMTAEGGRLSWGRDYYNDRDRGHRGGRGGGRSGYDDRRYYVPGGAVRGGVGARRRQRRLKIYARVTPSLFLPLFSFCLPFLCAMRLNI